ncbi:MAG: hypothetical protein ACREN8_03980 [Candidatus Dormibacteraceae bacterium]
MVWTTDADGMKGTLNDPDGKFDTLYGPTAVPEYAPGTHNWFETFQKKSVYKGGVCQLQAIPWQGLGLHIVPFPINAQTSPPPGAAAVQPFANQLANQLQANAGSIGTLPQAHGTRQGSVGMAQCFWLDNLPPERDATVTLPGAVDQTGRQIYYQLFLQAKLDKVDWDFGDGGGGQQVPLPAQCANHAQMTAYKYTKISPPGQTFQVRSTQRWNVSATLHYVDAGGVEPVIPVNVGNPIQAVNSAPDGVIIGQIEGVAVN